MKNLSARAIYYVENYSGGAISIIDGSKNEVVKKIICGLQPYDIVSGNGNKIIIANSGSDTISIICSNRIVKNLKMPNNGHITSPSSFITSDFS